MSSCAMTGPCLSWAVERQRSLQPLLCTQSKGYICPPVFLVEPTLSSVWWLKCLSPAFFVTNPSLLQIKLQPWPWIFMKSPEQLKAPWHQSPVLNSAVSVARAERWDLSHTVQQESPVCLTKVTVQYLRSAEQEKLPWGCSLRDEQWTWTLLWAKQPMFLERFQSPLVWNRSAFTICFSDISFPSLLSPALSS